MFDPVLQIRTVDVQVRSRWALPVSVLSHIMGIGVIVAASLLVTVSMKDPEPFIIFAALAPLPPPPAPAPPAAPAATDPRQQVEENVPDPDEILQPHETLEELPIVEESGSEDVGSAGVLGGVPGGDPDGVPGGVPDGVPDGVLGGPPGSTGPADRIPRFVTPEMTPPVLKRKLEPEYPEIARNSRLQGRVILQAVISTTGKVEEVTIIRSSNPLFDEAAIEAVRRWEYEPARQGGRPVAVYFTIDVTFSLR